MSEELMSLYWAILGEGMPVETCKIIPWNDKCMIFLNPLHRTCYVATDYDMMKVFLRPCQ